MTDWTSKPSGLRDSVSELTEVRERVAPSTALISRVTPDFRGDIVVLPEEDAVAMGRGCKGRGRVMISEDDADALVEAAMALIGAYRFCFEDRLFDIEDAMLEAVRSAESPGAPSPAQALQRRIEAALHLGMIEPVE